MLEGIGLICKEKKNNIKWNGIEGLNRRKRPRMFSPSKKPDTSEQTMDKEVKNEPVASVDPELREKYLAVEEEKRNLESIEKELDSYI